MPAANAELHKFIKNYSVNKPKLKSW